MTQSEKLGHNGDEEIIKELVRHKLEHNGDDEIIKEMCVCNGVSYEKISQDGSKIPALEMFFSGFPRMVGLSFFPKLISLTIVGQNIRQIQGLDRCPLLKELWIVECQLNEISGLQNCLQLQKLFLYDNKIKNITNLELLINLRVLWLNNNLISEIEGLNTLEDLKELNLADNLIEIIGHSLDQNMNLKNLNISGNKISSFKELTHLARLSKLRVLDLKDPQSSPNPVCLLCNYCTHVLYHIPSLQRLDSYDVSSKIIKDTAESTVMKKMMYYNMRVHCAQRQFDETKAKLLQQKKQQLQLPEERIRTLSYSLKNLECRLSEVQSAGWKRTRVWQEASPEQPQDTMDQKLEALDPGYEQRLQHKLNSIRERTLIWKQQLEEVEVCFQRDVTQASGMKDLLITFLVIELETVGNIRFEEGNTNDQWFTSCYDLLLSRFCVWDYKPHNITGIKINRIMRVHNRALRLRFEDKLHSLLDSDDSPVLFQNYKRCLEYLFYVPDPERCTETNEILQILKNGFKSADSYKALGRDGAVPLSNSVSVCEWPRMRFCQKQATKPKDKKPADPLPFRHGQLIISKVFLGQSVPARDGVAVDSDRYPKAHSVYRKSSVKKHKVIDGKAGGDAVCSSEQQGSCDCGQRKTTWYVFDHELVLPEYLIDFEYITQTPLSFSILNPADALPVSYDDQALDEKVLALEPVLIPQTKLHSLDEKSILTAARANILSQITVLNLHGNSLKTLKEISRLTSLRNLTISFNDLTHLDDISHLPNLECVDASFNQVVSLEGMRGLGRLRKLDLRWNQLTHAKEDIMALRKNTPCLMSLDTRHNPWLQGESVRMVVLGRLKGLTHLDGVLVTEEEAITATQMATTSKINQASLLVHSRTDAERPRCLSLFTAAQLITHFTPSPWTHTAQLDPGWTAKITAVNLDGQRLCRISNLDKLVSLRWASFNNNELSRIEGLEHCLLLEELSLNNNNISSLEGLCKLQHLTRLSFNNNQVQCLDGSVLDNLPNLHFLSAESNCISSLHGVQRSRSLFELYVGRNNISTSRDIYHLKALTNLIILDLYGNPLVEKLENYRVYVVFHLPSIKALDGIAVEISESENAKDVFGGRLTPDMVTEKLGHTNYRDMVELDMTACSIRMVDLAPADLFLNLRNVNLERNNLTSFSGLIYLPNIKALCLNHNHIESILPRQKAQTHLSNRQALYQKVHSSGYGQQNSSKTSRDLQSGDGLEPLMASLEVLYLGYNGISNLTELQISRLTNLKALFLQGNEISQVEGLEGLQRLRELVLERNRIKAVSVSSFAGQAALLELRLSENRIRDLSHLQTLNQLRRLFLDTNKIQDVAELDKLEALQSLIELSVAGNPVARRSLHRSAVVLHFPRLQVLDGITVTMEERTRAELLFTEGQYSSSSGAGVDMMLPGLLVLSRPPPFRGSSLSSGHQHLLTHEILITANLEEAQHNTKHKKQRVGGTHSRSAQSDGRHRGASSLPNTGLLANSHRVYINYPNADTENRYQNHSGTKPPPI